MSGIHVFAHLVLSFLQMMAGLCIFVGATRVLIFCLDQHSPFRKLFLWVSIQTSGVWYGLDPILVGTPTSTIPGILFAFILAWVLVAHWEVVHAVVEGKCKLECAPNYRKEHAISIWPKTPR